MLQASCRTSTAKDAAVQLEKVEDLQQIMIHGVMSSGDRRQGGPRRGVPTRAKVESWFWALSQILTIGRLNLERIRLR
ncbi:hypothetical protein [Sulfuritalea sp.]|uniref:hypothetical protein n=1 Tax=Sulfuritalea sp. TaxID=2480090 RepID=UPI00286E1576|nr:hypothetical protein [Sulfuritalea sp.]